MANIEDMEKSIESGDLEKAGAELKELLAVEPGPEAEADAYINAAEVYATAVNAINERRKAALEKAIEAIEDIDSAEKRFASQADDAAKLAKVREDLDQPR
ncbi:MAG: hypothetical protein KGI66_04630 [Patescibacteria group bacterium]|nr:hypothetical protein [Patescibacteria group bacterium]